MEMKDLKIEFTRSSGPGGQSVNKTESACRITHVPSGVQAFIQEQRDQDANRKRAMEVLKEKLFKIEHDKYVSDISSRRKLQIGTSDRSDKIRTYNFPQDRITDHRIGMTRFGIPGFLGGGDIIKEYIDAFKAVENEAKIQEMLESTPVK